MKKTLLLLGMLSSIACTVIRDDEVLFMHNFPVPKTLSFDLTSQTVLQMDTFDLHVPDTLIMNKLDWDKTVEIMFLLADTKRLYIDPKYSFHYDHDRLLALENDRSFHVYGKLDLHPDISSIVLYDISPSVAIQAGTYFDSVWLLNFKNNQLHSIAVLQDLYGYSIFNAKNKKITKIIDDSGAETMCDWGFFDKLECFIRHKDRGCFAEKSYTKFKVNEEGYIEFVR